MAEKTTARKLTEFSIDNPYADRGEDGFFQQSVSICGSTKRPIELNGEAFDGFKFQLWVPLPKLPSDCMEALTQEVQNLFGKEVDATGFLMAACRQIMYSCDVSKRDSVKDAFEAGDYETAHAEAQDAYNTYEVGRRSVAGSSVKAKAKELDEIDKTAKELGLTRQQLIDLAVANAKA